MLKTHWLTARRFGTRVALTTDEEKGHSQDHSLVGVFQNQGGI
jgi:hypothetical protein